MAKTGIWLIGARGNVATTTIVGARALAHGETNTTGLVTEREPCSRLDLPEVNEFVFGGHDIRETNLVDMAQSLVEEDIIGSEIVEVVEDDLRHINERIKTGTAVNCGAAVTDLGESETLENRYQIREIVQQIQSDYESFERDQDLDRVIVVNVASTEPALIKKDRYDTRKALEHAIETDDRDLPASSLYAYAALVNGYPYINFTPSTGSELGGLKQIAQEENVPHMGKDAKTGETLVKSALAPMFASRNLRVKSWEGHNILGNVDGKVLEDEENKEGKLESKGGVLDSILPEIEHNRVRIDYTPSLGDWKTAWDYIHFEGFLDTEMKMQFIWEGADSTLAAPLVIDLARLIAYADEQGASGLQPHLASFFKQPLGVTEQGLVRQFELLEEYVNQRAETIET